MTEPKKRGRKPKAIEPVVLVEVVEVVDVVTEPVIEAAPTHAARYTSARRGRLGLGHLVFEPGQTKTLSDADLAHPAIARAIATGLIKAA